MSFSTRLFAGMAGLLTILCLLAIWQIRVLSNRVETLEQGPGRTVSAATDETAADSLDGGTAARDEPVASSGSAGDMTTGRPALPAGMSGIYFVNTDTMLLRYTRFKKQQDALEARGRRFERDLEERVSNLQREFAQAQQRAQAGGMTPTQMQALEQELGEKQQRLGQYREREAQKLVEEEQALSRKLTEEIQRFMKSYGRQRGAQYVLGYSSSGGILYANDSLDITREVIRGLNAQPAR